GAVPVVEILTSDGGSIAAAELPARSIPLGNGTLLGEIELPLAKITTATKVILHLSIKGMPIANEWDLWVYPAKMPAIEAGEVLVVDRLDAAATAALEAGRKVMLLPQAGSVKGDRFGKVPAGFTSIFWNTAWTHRQAPHTLGILCDPKHPALADFPTEFHSNWQWWDLVRKSQIMILNDLPPQVRPVVQVIDDWVTNRRLGLVFEAAVGKGKLLVCGIDLKNDLASRPVARQMLSSLMRYMNSPAFNPKQKVEMAQVHGLFVEPPVMQALGAKVAKADSEEPGFEGSRAIDGDPRTFWHTPWQTQQPDYPHEIQIDLQKSIEFKGFRYVPRQDVHNGWANEYAFYASEDGKEWGSPVVKGTLTQNADEKRILFERPVKARFIRFVAVSGFNGQKFATLSEIDVIVDR
ncbi:MAG: discoidin domain-containing protein, partial [Bacillota bacterium]